MASITIKWHGPRLFTPFWDPASSVYSDSLAWQPGIYLWTFPEDGAYWINYVGIAHAKSIASRQSEHLGTFLSGNYLFYLSSELRVGDVTCAYRPSEGHEKYIKKLPELVQQLQLMQIFFAPLDSEKALLERIESGLITSLRDQGGQILKRLANERLSRHRKHDEATLDVGFESSSALIGMPTRIVV